MKTAILIVVASVHFTGSYFNQSELSSVQVEQSEVEQFEVEQTEVEDGVDGGKRANCAQ